MFYVLSSKFLATKNKNIYHTFIIGSACYVAVHYALFSFKYSAMIEKFKYIFYVLFLIDLGIWLYMEKKKEETILKDKLEEAKKIQELNNAPIVEVNDDNKSKSDVSLPSYKKKDN